MKVLFYRYGSICESDILDAFQSLHLEVIEEKTEMIRKKIPVQERIQILSTLLLTHKPFFAFSINFFPLISDICEKLHILYVCLTVDCPVLELLDQSIQNSCNRIFLFDRVQYDTIHHYNPDRIFHLPLAVNTKRYDEIIGEHRSFPDYQYEVSFVGSMYRKNSYDEIKDMLPDYVRGYFDALMKLQLEIYGENYIDGMLTAEIMDELNRHFRIEKSERSFSNISLIFSTTVLGFKIAQLERYKLLGALSKRFDVSVFTDDENADFVLAHNMGPVRYWDESPVVFYTSRINLNFTIRNIRSGIPLRVWDILAAGGFCITNFQPELVLYFKNGEDLVWFEDEADLVRKVRYYLEHEEERKQIALMGQRKVRELHNYDVRISEIERELGRQLV